MNHSPIEYLRNPCSLHNRDSISVFHSSAHTEHEKPDQLPKVYRSQGTRRIAPFVMISKWRLSLD